MSGAGDEKSPNGATSGAGRICPACRSQSFRAHARVRDRMHHLGGEFTVIRCADCGLVSYEPFPDERRVMDYYPRDYYAHQSPRVDAAESGGMRRLLDDLHLGLRPAGIGTALLKILLAPALWYKWVYGYAHYLRGIPPGRLLDVGAGDGAFLRKARRMGFDAEGLEPGSATTRFADGTTIHGCSLAEFASKAARGGRYNVITLNHVFEHLLDPAGSLKMLSGLLAPGGRILIRMPRTDHAMFREHPEAWFPLEIPRHVYLYDPMNFRLLAEANGLRVAKVIPECIPTHWQLTLKALWFGRDFDAPHWIDRRLISAAMLPFCKLLKWTGGADCMAIWLARADAGGKG